jgi:hypothetical protein
MRPKGEMKMIWHETVRQEPHGNLVRSLTQQRDEGLIIPVCMKDLGPAIATIDDVVAVVTD